ncbi:MAG TPA: hypothetical protein DD381_13565 [Lentisphaeria bacterium]|nr:MAG: hypothetical protein A2X47_03910 [Lentisphaerae bacterium GWF2_38_69]HBM17350.1 hypothetical protein [Lentisphaeria bacterium]
MKQLFTTIFLLLFLLASAGENKVQSEYLKDLAAFKDHQFDKNQIKSFVYYWYSLHDVHADINKSYELLDKENLYMKFPEITVKNLDDYKKWYEGVGNNIKNNLHFVKYLEVIFDGSHKYKVNVIVNWQATDKDGKFINMDATQEWELVDPSASGIDHPLIQKYLVLEFKDN